MELTDINGLLDQIVNFAANHTDMYHVSVKTNFSEEIPEILVDGDQLRQVAINLILNSGAAMPRGGTLIVGTSRAEDNFIEIAFADTGAGIPPENLEKIFEPFFTTKEKGTGLGLAITRQIIEMHHGSVKIDSTVGVGTTVTIRLPVDQEEL
jgi:two-component system NtrC family sensor kinase